jgi:hypothetical protein
MARDSEQSDQAVILEIIDRLLVRFRPDYVQPPAVSNSVRSIQLSEIDEVTGELINSYVVVATHAVTRELGGARRFHPLPAL